jgi:hypothetical protein
VNGIGLRLTGGTALVRTAVVTLGEVVDRIVAPEPDPRALPTPASITTYTTGGPAPSGSVDASAVSATPVSGRRSSTKS